MKKSVVVICLIFIHCNFAQEQEIKKVFVRYAQDSDQMFGELYKKQAKILEQTDMYKISTKKYRASMQGIDAPSYKEKTKIQNIEKNIVYAGIHVYDAKGKEVVVKPQRFVYQKENGQWRISSWGSMCMFCNKGKCRYCKKGLKKCYCTAGKCIHCKGKDFKKCFYCTAGKCRYCKGKSFKKCTYCAKGECKNCNGDGWGHFPKIIRSMKPLITRKNAKLLLSMKTPLETTKDYFNIQKNMMFKEYIVSIQTRKSMGKIIHNYFTKKIRNIWNANASKRLNKEQLALVKKETLHVLKIKTKRNTALVSIARISISIEKMTVYKTKNFLILKKVGNLWKFHNRAIVCPRCQGSGLCFLCKGGSIVKFEKCQSCAKTSKVAKKKCSDCNGKGKRQKKCHACKQNHKKCNVCNGTKQRWLQSNEIK